MSRKKKQLPTESEFIRLLESPERRISIAAVALTGGNYIAGVVIEMIRANEGKPITMCALADACHCTYGQIRTALTALVDAGLIEKKEQDIPYIYNRERSAPERKPYFYTLTHLGEQCTPRKVTTPTIQPPAEKQTVALIPEAKPKKAPVIDGEKIARECGLLRGSVIDYTDYDRKIQFLSSEELEAVKAFLDSKQHR